MYTAESTTRQSVPSTAARHSPADVAPDRTVGVVNKKPQQKELPLRQAYAAAIDRHCDVHEVGREVHAAKRSRGGSGGRTRRRSTAIRRASSSRSLGGLTM